MQFREETLYGKVSFRFHKDLENWLEENEDVQSAFVISTSDINFFIVAQSHRPYISIPIVEPNSAFNFHYLIRNQLHSFYTINWQ